MVMWIDTGDAAATTTRDATATITLSSRPANQALTRETIPPSGLSVDGQSRFAVGRQNDRHVLQFDSMSTGITGTWGPFGTNGSWTIILFLKVDQPVNDYGTTYIGLGKPMALISSPSVSVSIELPSGGSIPTVALYNAADPTNGGPIDGVLAGAPWDIPFVDHWRQLCVQNNTTTGLRTTYVDGFLINTSVATNQPVPANTAVTIGGACPLSLCELLVWDDVPLSLNDMSTICKAQRIKWDVPMATQPTVLAAPSTNRALLLLPAALADTPHPPSPSIWLDSTRGVHQDTAGTHIAPANGRVRLWKDQGTSVNHCVFPGTARTMYGVTPLDCINNRLPVVKILSGPGSFQRNPLAETSITGFTIICVWRTVATVDGGGGHPLSGIVPSSLIGDDGWVEWLGLDVARRVSLPGAIPAGTVLVACWERSPNGQTTWRLNTLTDTGGYRWTGTVPTINTSTPFTIATSKSGLQLAQFLLWNRVLGVTERDMVTAWLTTVWGIPLPTPIAGPAPFPIPDAGIPAQSDMLFWLDATAGLYRNNAPVDVSMGGSVTKWCDRTQRHCDGRENAAASSRQRDAHHGHRFGVGITEWNPVGGDHQCGDVQQCASLGRGGCRTVLHRGGVSRHRGTSVQRERAQRLWVRPFGWASQSNEPDIWTEAIAVPSTWRIMPVVFPSSTAMLVAWYYNGTTLTHRVHSLLSSGGGYTYTETGGNVPSDWTTVYSATVGTQGRTLQLAELMAWKVALSAVQLGSLDAYLRTKWGLPPSVTPMPAMVSTLPTREGVVTFPAADAKVLFAVGMRRILPSYGATAPILRIRRVNDNAEINLIASDEIRRSHHRWERLRPPTVLVVDDGTKRSATQWAGSGVEIRVSKWYTQDSLSPMVRGYSHRWRIRAMP